MINTIISTAIAFIVSTMLGYCLNVIRTYKNKDKAQSEALKCLLRSSITSKYYVYSELKTIPIYEKENCNYMFEQYKKMGGNSYIDEIMAEVNSLPLKK